MICMYDLVSYLERIILFRVFLLAVSNKVTALEFITSNGHRPQPAY